MRKELATTAVARQHVLLGSGAERDRHAPADAPSPLGALRGPGGRNLRVAILSDFIRVPYANGAVFQTRFLYRQLRANGHEVALVAASDPDASPDELAPGTVALPSLPLRSYPGLRLPLPPAPWEPRVREWDYDLVFAQANSLLLLFGVWLRELNGTPLLCVNTTHLKTAYDVLLPPSLAKMRLAHEAFRVALEPFERFYIAIYNASDGLVVLSEGLRDYWRSRGVEVPIHVIPRAVQSEFFDAPCTDDPYPGLLGPELAKGRGRRLICAGRHVREKAQDRVIRIFARHVLPSEPAATLTMVGDGPDLEYYKRLAGECGAAERVFFTGEVPFSEMPAWYTSADVFVHASLSETYGNVLGEALWCGCPVVAFADGMGASAQVLNGVNGLLLPAGGTPAEKQEGDEAMGRALVGLLRDPQMHTRFREAGVRISRARTSPRAVEQRIASAFLDARERAAALRLGKRKSPAARWLTTAKLFGPWWLLHLAISAAGCMRPAARRRAPVTHPRIWR